MNILLVAILVVFLAFMAGLVLVCLRLRAIIREFVSSPAENQPSPFAIWCDSVAMVFARAITAQIKTTLMGVQSGSVRAEKAIEADIAEDMLSQSPIGALLDSFPTLRKSIRRNPALLPLVQGALQRVFKGGNGGSQVSSASQPKFKL